jgi:hypothetical protein
MTPQERMCPENGFGGFFRKISMKWGRFAESNKVLKEFIG